MERVRLKIPNCDVCSSGAKLVDLPGVSDYNAARENVTKEVQIDFKDILLVKKMFFCCCAMVLWPFKTQFKHGQLSK